MLSLRELASRDGIDLAASFAYSDSESDLPMLRAVGHPVVVNPDPELARIAAEEGWEVLRLDRLGRRLKIAVALSAGVSLAGLGGVVRGRAAARTATEQPAAAPRRHNPGIAVAGSGGWRCVVVSLFGRQPIFLAALS